MKLLSSRSHGLEEVRMTIAPQSPLHGKCSQRVCKRQGQRGWRKTNKDLGEDLASGAGQFHKVLKQDS